MSANLKKLAQKQDFFLQLKQSSVRFVFPIELTKSSIAYVY